jgi:hypothetical protein
MPAGPIGSRWGAGTWPDTAWEAQSWGGSAPGSGGGSAGSFLYGYLYTRVSTIGVLLLAARLAWGMW